MFNAANILEALKNYIHTHGGTSNAYNIAEAVNDLNSIPQGSGGGIPEAPIDNKQYARKNGDWSEVESSGEDIPPEVSNAVETHGIGWTDEEVVEGFDITWDGDITGLDVIENAVYKVAEIDSITSASDLIGSVMEVVGMGFDSPHIFSSADITTEDNKVFMCLVESSAIIFVAFEDGTAYDIPFTKGVWFTESTETAYVSRLYKEASTQEVVHQIDQKYIPQSSGGAMFVTVVFDDNLVGTADKTLSELVTAYESGMNVIATIEAFNMTIGKVTCMQYAQGNLLFGMPERIDDEGVCLPPLQVYDSDGADVWETNMI